MPEQAYCCEMAGPPKPVPKVLIWVGTSKEDLSGFDEEVRRVMGFALFVAQLGDKHPDAKVLRGFGSAGVLEVIEDSDGATFRSVYTVKFSGRLFVLHAFQKKSKKGAKTPKAEIDLVKKRLEEAERIHAELGPVARITGGTK